MTTMVRNGQVDGLMTVLYSNGNFLYRTMREGQKNNLDTKYLANGRVKNYGGIYEGYIEDPA